VETKSVVASFYGPIILWCLLVCVWGNVHQK